MSTEDSKYEKDPDLGGHEDVGGGSSQGLGAEFRRFRHEVKLFIPNALRLGVMIGNIAMDAHRLVAHAARLFARLGGRAALLGAAIGLTSPLFRGWGAEPLARSGLATWAPVAILAVTFLAVRTIVVLFGPIDRESEREKQRRSDRQPQPGLDEHLRLDAGRRRVVNESLNGNAPADPLDESGFVGDVLAEACYQLGVRGQKEIVLTLRRWAPKRGLKEVATRGAIDDIVNGRLDGIGWEDLVDMDRALHTALAPLEYAHWAVAFTAGRHDYVLLGLSGAHIPDHARQEMSHAATRLVEMHATGGSAVNGGGVA